ncbi:hypothetical protein Nepgr_005540 [Nepenthes gracilis]|uniref:Uncharacterized protein n=1 Tax=Nepenthes gracilis TaxID=150966 RepID=A0AAD3S3H9_NEPGR|nr:hypothetical protein Nepgr_005540 [Nepenthes gracilis]
MCLGSNFGRGQIVGLPGHGHFGLENWIREIQLGAYRNAEFAEDLCVCDVAARRIVGEVTSPPETEELQLSTAMTSVESVECPAMESSNASGMTSSPSDRSSRSSTGKSGASIAGFLPR